MKSTEGQSGVSIWVERYGNYIQVEPVTWSAKRLGVTPRTIRRKCDEGKLIGIKINGQWWVAIDYDHDETANGLPF